MNVSLANMTLVIQYRDSYAKAVTKNVIVIALGISINFINANLIHTFRKHQIFNTNPRYILFIHLVVNDMIQLTLTVGLFLLSYILHRINVSLCCFFILLALFTTENTPLNLACMVAECFVAVCLPLRHAQLCTVRRTYLLMGLIWATSIVSVLPDLFISLVIEPLDFFYSQVFCLRESAFRSPHLIMKRDVYYVVYLVVVWLTILYAYLRIMITARAANTDAKNAKKAMNTVLLHGIQLLLCMSTYIDPLLKQLLAFWFPENYRDSLFACYIINQILPRFISPIIYGLRDKNFRTYLAKDLMCKVTMATHTKTVFGNPS